MIYARDTIKRYLDDLAAKKAAPGGGSAAALEAATGCALISMVLNFTISNKRYAAVKEKAESGLKRSEELRKGLLRLIDEDVKAYGSLSKGFKNHSPGLKRLYKDACNVPYDICRLTNEGMDLCGELVSFGNKNLITDTAIAALMLESAFFGARLNVYINLKYINDKGYVSKLHKVLSILGRSMSKNKNEVLRKTKKAII
ncbi:MAG: cyclodeaminase/cyclohydrolase family protein [Candidatus Omnitrophica bacterium]|nr:cyclodeaminase/cyclohydrolase family protein [Candidatus Omnitrophota bacterium]